MKLRLNAHAQCENIDSCAETTGKSKKCASDKNSHPVRAPLRAGRGWPSTRLMVDLHDKLQRGRKAPSCQRSFASVCP